MSAAPSTSTIELWASWEGHVINGAYPLRRYLGSSDHSGVFLTEARNTSVAIKIAPAIPAYAEVQLSRWLTAGELDHPNLVGIFEAGRCQVDGRPYLYALMEYADQDLAQLLQRRALTEEEAREMLVPTLTALGFLHQKKFVQGRVKPSNVLVVGDRLKLASDTICRVGEAVDGAGPLSAYESPEARETGRTEAGDIWALGVTICEALTRRQPLALHGGGNPVFPVDLSPAFRELTAWCLSRRASDRPDVAELEASLRGERTVPIAIPAVEPGELATSYVEESAPSPPPPAGVEVEGAVPVVGAGAPAEGSGRAGASAAEAVGPEAHGAASVGAEGHSAHPGGTEADAAFVSERMDVGGVPGLPQAPSAANAEAVVPASAPVAPVASVAPAAPGDRPAASLRGSIEVAVVPGPAVPAPMESTASPANEAPGAAPPPPVETSTATAVEVAGRAPVEAAPPTHVEESESLFVEAPAPRPIETAARAPAPAAAPQSLGSAPAGKSLATKFAIPAPAGKPAGPQSYARARGPASESAQADSIVGDPKRYLTWAASLAAVLIVAWGGMKLLGSSSSDIEADSVVDADVSGTPDTATGTATASDTASDTARGTASDTPRGTASDTPRARTQAPATGTRASAVAARVASAGSAAPARNVRAASPTTSESQLSSSEVNEVLPDVPNNARRTIRGRVRVSVRVIVEKDGTVFAALADNPGPSRYFERLAIDAAKKWTFTPSDSDEQRLMLVRFVFERQGTTATATALR